MFDEPKLYSGEEDSVQRIERDFGVVFEGVVSGDAMPEDAVSRSVFAAGYMGNRTEDALYVRFGNRTWIFRDLVPVDPDDVATADALVDFMFGGDFV